MRSSYLTINYTSIKESTKAGRKAISSPFEIIIGKCAIIKDPWDKSVSYLGF
ncbi:MAG: hypothetical protein HZR80_01205 [Candidatus Heimdallarchaeota archaeon]